MKTLLITIIFLLQINNSENDLRLEGHISNDWDTNITFSRDSVILKYSSESGYGGSHTDTGTYKLINDTIVCNFPKTNDTGPYLLRLNKHGFVKTNRKNILISLRSNIVFNPRHSFRGGHYYIEEMERIFKIKKTNLYFFDKKNKIIDSTTLQFDRGLRYVNRNFDIPPYKLLIDLGNGISQSYKLPIGYNEYYLNTQLEEPFKFGKPKYQRKLKFKKKDSIIAIQGYKGNLKLIETFTNEGCK